MNLNKYSRQIALPFIGTEGQVSLFQAKILIIGAGALSHSSSIYLATSGIGHISIIDFDIIEESNLSRQICFRQEDIGKYKAEILSKNLKNYNKDLNISFYNTKFTENIFNEMKTNFDIILNASDNFETRKMINTLSLKYNIPWVDIGIFQTKAHFCLFKPGYGCYHCLFPDIIESNENCSLMGVLSPICGIMGSFAANEIIKFIILNPNSKMNNYFNFNFMENTFKEYYWTKNLECELCCNYKYQLEIKSKLKNDQYEINFEHILNRNDNYFIIYLDEDFKKTKQYLTLKQQSIPFIQKSIYHFFDNNKIGKLANKHYFYNKKIILICKFGIKSKTACDILRKNKFHSYFLSDTLKHRSLDLE